LLIVRLFGTGFAKITVIIALSLELFMTETITKVQADFNQFILGFNTLTLATVSADGIPEASYAPFIRVAGVWYVFVSELAQHTQNLMVMPQASVLLIEAEQNTVNLFARKRASFQMRVHEVSRETSEWHDIIDAFEVRFGDIVSMIRGLSDFHLMALTPISGSFVRGFAQAFVLGGEDMLLVANRREREARASSAGGNRA
jgi:putative heme iron utilization protein